MLEYESIPGVVSSLRMFKSERKTSEEIVTVKDITNKVRIPVFFYKKSLINDKIKLIVFNTLNLLNITIYLNYYCILFSVFFFKLKF